MRHDSCHVRYKYRRLRLTAEGGGFPEIPQVAAAYYERQVLQWPDLHAFPTGLYYIGKISVEAQLDSHPSKG